MSSAQGGPPRPGSPSGGPSEPSAPVAFTSDELNYLVYRYLVESGFTHAAYTFGLESDVLNRLAGTDKHPHHRPFDDLDAGAELKATLERKEAMQRVLQNVQQGALVSIVQKGLQYVEVETHLMEDGTARPCAAPLSLLHPHVCIEPNSAAAEAYAEQQKARAKAKAKRRAQREKFKKEGEIDELNGTDMDQIKAESGGPVAMEDVRPELPNGPPSMVISDSITTVFEGHGGEVFTGSWWNGGSKGPSSSADSFLATGSGDGTARLWTVPRQPGGSGSQCVILDNAMNAPENKDVTTMAWNPNGTLLATGSYDGKARVWAFTPQSNPSAAPSDSADPQICGENAPVNTTFGTIRLVNTMANHSGPVFSLRWNRSGDLLLSGSVDKTCVVWDWEAGAIKGRWALHEAPTLDVDWMPPGSVTGPQRDVFASCSSDQKIHIVGVWNTEGPLCTLRGHTAEINCVKWDPEGKLLGSCGDDGKVFVWSWDGIDADGKTGRGSMLRELVGHEREVYTLRWCPPGPAAGGRKLMATGSFDSTVRIWDALSGACLHHLKRHVEPIYSVSFHPTSLYLAVGSFDQTISLWSVEDGQLLRSYEGQSGIFDVAWNPTGDRISVCFADRKVVVIHANLLRLPGIP